MHSDIHEVQTNTVRFHLCERPTIVKFIESESTLVDAWGWRCGVGMGMGSQCLTGTEFQFRRVKNSGEI